MAVSNNICTHLTLGKCSCTATETEESDSNSNEVCTHLTLSVCQCTRAEIHVSSTKKRKLCHKGPFVARKKACKDLVVQEDALVVHDDDDPWKIKKVLKESDLGNMSRLMLGKDLAEKFVLPVLGDAAEIEKGVSVKIWDVDTYTMHSLVFKKWVSSRCYIFMGKWVQDFVKRRGLKKGDELGFYWDPYNSHFNFSVLRVN
ncbi:putative B3 domain-containing protein At1g78640 [Abrus precatorius]|uniref:B3 domain-containing protein At1g78640 n=1 Tax=Abrus precatorius TaxID=3816 RepID=A0A8B8K0J4_ABRPR|nr:putative B3 domain-containing protein At1g78640 [Abrus precatorius]